MPNDFEVEDDGFVTIPPYLEARDSYFPILIKLQETQKHMLIRKATSIPSGVAFTVVETRVDTRLFDAASNNEV